MEFNVNDLNDYCSLCNKQQNAVSNLSGKSFQINTIPRCGHKFCDDCIRREFARKRSFLCPKCGTSVTQDKLSTKTMEEVEVEKDISVRRQIKLLFNKTEDDFNDLNAFKDYEELVEDIIFNLVHEIDVPETKARIEKYKKENADLIAKNQLKLTQMLREEMNQIKEEEILRAQKELEFHEQLKNEFNDKKAKEKLRNSTLLGDTVANSAPLLPSQQLQQQQQQPMLAMGVDRLNPVQMFLAQRAEPRPLTAAPKPDPSNNGDKKPVSRSKLAHQAGGYEYINWDRRNWVEIRSQLTDRR